jgi:hypothetical protein
MSHTYATLYLTNLQPDNPSSGGMSVMVASQAPSRREQPSAISALEASLAGVVVMSLFAFLIAPALRLPVIDLTLFDGVPTLAPGAADFLFALFKLWPIGIVAGLLYAYGVAPYLPGPNWLKGMLYGLALFLLLSLIAMPLAGLLHPNVTGGRVPQPGWLGLGLGGWLVPIVLLADHLIFGLLLGTVYHAGPRAVDRGDGREL